MHSLKADDVPIFGHLANPLHPGVLHLGVWVESLGNGLEDNGSSPGLVLFDSRLCFRDEGINGRSLFVKIGDDGGLLGERGKYVWQNCKFVPTQITRANSYAR